MKKLKNFKNNNKGFTLVEIVIVLVIIAILAAMLVPSMSGWIEDSKRKTFITEARSAMTATQSELSKYYATDNNIPTSFSEGSQEMKNIAKKTGAKSGFKVSWTLDGENQMTTFKYQNNKYKVEWTKENGFGTVESLKSK